MKGRRRSSQSAVLSAVLSVLVVGSLFYCLSMAASGGPVHAADWSTDIDNSPGTSGPTDAVVDAADDDPQLLPEPSPEPVVIRADGFIQILAGGEEVMAQEGVEVCYQDTRIRADELHYLVEQGRAYFTGNVEVEQAEQYVRSTYIEYDFKLRTSRMDQARAVLSPGGLEGDVYLRGDIETAGDRILIRGGTATTCDLDQPHFHLEAGELEIYPGDKMIIRQVSYWEGKLPLFYWPYLVVPLGRESAFELPLIGYSPSEGWFVKMAYNYYRNPQSYGKLHLDYMQKKGYGTGVTHTYADHGENGSGTVFIYRLYNPKTAVTTWEGDWDHIWQLHPGLEVALGASYWLEPQGGSTADSWRLEPRIALTGESQTGAYKARAEQRRSYTDELAVENEFDWHFRQNMGNAWQLTSQGHGLLLGPLETKGSYLLYDHTLRRLTAGSDLQVKLQQDVHPAVRGSSYTSFTWETLQRLPEISWRSRNLTVLDDRIPLQLRALAGHYQETYPSQPGLVATKLQLDAGIASKRFNWGQKAYFTYDGGVELHHYTGLTVTPRDTVEGGEAVEPLADRTRLVLLSRPRVVVRPIEPLSIALAYTDRWVLGESPFLFDEMKNSETFSAELSWRTPTFGASIGSGYDFWDRSYNDITGQVHIRPDERYELNVWASYSIEDAAWQTARGAINLMPSEDLSLRFASVYDFTRQTWDSLNGQLRITFPNKWRLEYMAGYSATREEWTQSSAMLAVDLHCRELRFRYDQLNSAVWVEYSINAFPKTSLALGGGEQVDFRVDGLVDLVSQVTQAAQGQ